MRSQYLAEANLNLASAYAGYGPMTPGWYWDAGFWGYTWLPGDGLLWNPFGWGFYSPRYIYYGGPVFYGYRGGYPATMVEAMLSSTALAALSMERALAAAVDFMVVEGTAAVVKRR